MYRTCTTFVESVCSDKIQPFSILAHSVQGLLKIGGCLIGHSTELIFQKTLVKNHLAKWEVLQTRLSHFEKKIRIAVHSNLIAQRVNRMLCMTDVNFAPSGDPIITNVSPSFLVPMASTAELHDPLGACRPWQAWILNTRSGLAFTIRLIRQPRVIPPDLARRLFMIAQSNFISVVLPHLLR